jgi:FdrA protein
MNDKTIIKGLVKKGEYYDSVSLMQVARKLRELPGIIDSAVVMGSGENKAILESARLLVDEFNSAGDNDLLIAIAADDIKSADKAIAEIDSLLKSMKVIDDGSVSNIKPRTIAEAQKLIPDSNLALISIAGKYAGDEAMKALKSGLHVMMFSDNVSLKKEIELKKYAASKGLLIMGPDCGTAIINGVPLGFANAIKRGYVGIVAASGTGLQETSCIITNEGAGISQAIGTGGRDISEPVGGIMFIEAIKALADDPDTKVLLLISKPPHPDVLTRIETALKNITKPVVAVFLGADIEQLKNRDIIAMLSLEQGALAAVALTRNGNLSDIYKYIADRDSDLIKIAKSETDKFNRQQKYLRGLFSGGTFCYETQILLSKIISDAYSNAPWGNNHQLKSALQSEKHTLIDMGADEFTVGRLHPMIDYSLRNKRIIQEANDQKTAVILLDLVLGYGVIEYPLDEILPAIKEAQKTAKDNGRHLLIICSVTGTDGDPQNRRMVMQELQDAGVMVMESNAAACKLAGFIIKELAQR